MNSGKIRKIVVTSPELLSGGAYYRRLWLATRNMDIPRRDWLNHIADALRDFDGVITNEYGRRYSIPDVDEVFGDDPDMRWFSYYLRPDESGENPASKSRKFERLQLLDLYFRIKHPRIARHFKR